MVLKATKTDDLPFAVLYLRMSSDKQDMSIADQKAKVLPWARGKYRIVEVYIDEGKSGSKNTDRRTDFLRMVKDLTIGKHAGQVQFILSVDKSRFDRLDTLKGAKYKEELRNAGIKFDSPLNGLIDWSTAIGRMMDTMLSEANHTTPLLIAEKGLQGRIRVTKEGRPNSPTPYGMAKRVKSPTGEEITIKRGQPFATPKTWHSEFCRGEPVEAEAMEYAYETFSREDLSYNELARKMTEKGFPPPGKAGEWHGDTLCWMLRNPVYAGGLRIGETTKGGDTMFRVHDGKETAAGEATGESEPVYVWDTHTGIIDKPLWDRVQAKIARKLKTRSTPRNRGPYALSGVLFCGNCKQPMYGSKNEQGQVVYRCHRADVSPGKPCGYWIGYEAQILPVILGDFLNSIRQEIIRETSQPEVVPLNGQLAVEREELKALEEQLERGREAVLDAPKATRAGLLAALEKREQEKQALQERIRQESSQSQQGRLMEWWEAYQREFFESCPIDVGASLPGPYYPEVIENGHPDPLAVDPGLHAAPSEDGGSVIVVKTKIPASVLREKLKRIDTRATVWFKRKTKGRGYDLDRVRVQAYINGEVAYEYASTATSPQDTSLTVERWYDRSDLPTRKLPA